MAKERKIQERTIVNRQNIIKAATKLFQEKGYYNTNTKEIAKEAGVAIGSFYNYFGDKKAIFTEIMNLYLDENYNAIVDVFHRIDENPKQGPKLVKEYIESSMEHAKKSMGLFRDIESLCAVHPELRTMEGERAEQIQQLIVTQLEQSEYIIKRSNVEVMSFMMFATVEGLSNFICKLPEDTDKSQFVEQFAKIITWYLFGVE